MPIAPPEPIYVSSTADEIVLELGLSTDNGGLPILDYELEIDAGSSAINLGEAGVTSFTKIDDYDYATDGLSFTVSAADLSLTAGDLYRFRFRAKNLMGYSPYSDTVRLGLGGLPAAITTLARRDDGNSNQTAISVDWDELAAETLPVLEYILYVDDGYGVTYREAYRGGLTYAVVDSLESGREYRLTVGARNWNGYGPNSTEVVLRSCVPPLGVHEPYLVASAKEALTIGWSPPDDNGGCEVSGYKVYRDDGSQGAIDLAITFVESGSETAEPYMFETTITLGALFTGKYVRL
jgi:hypothetical protein